jgi:probable addiction module antidote protein
MLQTRSYKEWLGEKLSDPKRAARYLTAASEQSEVMFLKALRKVAQVQKRPMTEIAEACGVSRESLYRMLSETGNPTSENRRAILAALGLKSVVVPIENDLPIDSRSSANGSGAVTQQGTPSGNSTVGGPVNAGVSLTSGGALLVGPIGRKGPVRANASFESRQAGLVGLKGSVLQAGGQI